MIRVFRGIARNACSGRAVAVLMLLAVSTVVQGDAALTTADVARFLKAGISERTILAELGSRGFAEALDAAREATLREAGASETLIVAIRRVAPAEKAPAMPIGPPPPLAEGVVVISPQSVAPKPLTFAAGTRTVRVPVSVTDKTGQPVLGLKAADFRVQDDGVRRDVTLFSSERRALKIALALDISGSMHNKIRQVEAALRNFIDLLEPEDEILVITFANHVHVIQDFTADRQVLGARSRHAGAGRRHRALRRGRRSDSPRGAGAGREQGGGPGQRRRGHHQHHHLQRASGAGAPFRGAGLLDRPRQRRADDQLLPADVGRPSRRRRLSGRRSPRGRRPGGGGLVPGGGGMGGPGGGGMGGPGGGGQGGHGYAGPPRSGFDGNALKELADDTGGSFQVVKDAAHYAPGSEAPSNDQLKAAVESIAMTLRHRYLIGYEPPDGKKGWRTIKVDCERSASTARAKKGYYSGA